MTSVPTTTTDVTAEWLTSALRSSERLPAGEVTAVHADPAEAGVGFMGEVGKLELTYSQETDLPAQMVVKFPTASPEIKAMMRPTRVYEREHRFYAELAHETPLRTPDAYYVLCETSEDETVDEQYLMLLEDLSSLTLGDQVAGVSVDQAEAALAGLARHHARFWGGAGLETASFIPPINGPLNKAGQAIYEQSLPGFKEVFGDAVLPEMMPAADAYTAAQPTLLDMLAAMPTTLVHFDYRADNLFFEPDGTVVVIDWQSISQGGGAADVAYFISQNLSIEDRRANESDLLAGYHARLTEAGATGYDFETFTNDYRTGLIYGWVIPVFAVGSLDVSSERAMTLWTRVIERAQDAILQHNAHQIIL